MTDSTLDSTLAFTAFFMSGPDAETFLQAQLTVDLTQLAAGEITPTAICNLKGRVDFGLWIETIDDGFRLICSSDIADALIIHLKKYGVFSKITISSPETIYPCLIDANATFSMAASAVADSVLWQYHRIIHGQYWITQHTRTLFQPQELRLHQMGGVHYDKGCYLGQEVVARLYFKAAPKAYLHLIKTEYSILKTLDNVVNSVIHHQHAYALVVANPDMLNAIEGVFIQPLPAALSGSVARS